jgi:hypothetical protein
MQRSHRVVGGSGTGVREGSLILVTYINILF